ncbi:unnamed protein product [Allacma fusca]|uniref:Uncharacterized protein n=1 Tax=Allacma fusca TaxID=39272 RepID=A0A8J2LE11_9HEXA|nr:unnamed protein product [Allacma fusca]
MSEGQGLWELEHERMSSRDFSHGSTSAERLELSVKHECKTFHHGTEGTGILSILCQRKLLSNDKLFFIGFWKYTTPLYSCDTLIIYDPASPDFAK